MEYGDRRFEFEKPHEGLKGSLSSHPCFAPLAAALQPSRLCLCSFVSSHGIVGDDEEEEEKEEKRKQKEMTKEENDDKG